MEGVGKAEGGRGGRRMGDGEGRGGRRMGGGEGREEEMTVRKAIERERDREMELMVEMRNGGKEGDR